MKDRRGKEWFPLWVDKWLFGSTRIEFTPEERGVWVDLLAMAAKDNGYIRANIGVPYPLEQLAGLFIVSSELLSRVIEKSISTGKIERLQDGTLKILSWPKYSLSERWKREIESGKIEKAEVTSEKAEVTSEKAEPIYINRDINKNRDIHTGEEAGANHHLIENKKNQEDERLIGDIISRWNNFAQEQGLAKVDFIKPGTTRYQKLKARLKEKEFDFDAILKEIERSDFLKGASSNWRVTFDWIICPNNYPKVLEGQYKSKYYSSMDELEAWAKDDKNDKQK